MINEEMLDVMLASGCSAKQIVDTVKAALRADEARRADKREGNRKRQRNRRSKLRSQAVTRDPPHTPPQESTPSAPKGASVPSEFERWYREYPHKVGRGHAERAFVRARRLATLEALIAGVRDYAVKTDDRPWKNPATWLNGKCWLDQPAAPPRPGAQRSSKHGFGWATDNILQQMRNADEQGSRVQVASLAAPARDVPSAD